MRHLVAVMLAGLALGPRDRADLHEALAQIDPADEWLDRAAVTTQKLDDIALDVLTAIPSEMADVLASSSPSAWQPKHPYYRLVQAAGRADGIEIRPYGSST